MGRPSLRASTLRDLVSFGRAVPVTPDPIVPPQQVAPQDIRSGAVGGTHFYQVRNVIQIPFDDSIDSTYFLECFFQMPENVKKVSKARVWVQKKPFRTYNSAAAGAAGSAHNHVTNYTFASDTDTQSSTYSTANESAHTHVPAAMGNQGTLHTHVTQAPDAGGTTTTESLNHTHSQSATGGGSAHAHTVNLIAGHKHIPNFGGGTYLFVIGDSTLDHTTTSENSHSHTITLTPGIFESGGTGNLTLYVADDGSTYGAAIVGPTASNITDQDITSQLTLSQGDKRLKIVASALMRVQVLLVMDLLVGVDPLEIGIT